MTAPRFPLVDAVRGLERYAQRLGRRAPGVPPGQPEAGRPLAATAEAAQ